MNRKHLKEFLTEHYDRTHTGLLSVLPENLARTLDSNPRPKISVIAGGRSYYQWSGKQTTIALSDDIVRDAFFYRRVNHYGVDVDPAIPLLDALYHEQVHHLQRLLGWITFPMNCAIEGTEEFFSYLLWQKMALGVMLQ